MKVLYAEYSSVKIKNQSKYKFKLYPLNGKF